MTARAISANVSVVVPTFANAQALESLVHEISQVLLLERRKFEIILVNDGSPDATWDVVQRLHLAHPSVRGINLMRNYGQHSALLAGIFNARSEVIVTLDDDFQTPPTEIPKLLRKLDEGFDLVYGAREKEQQGFARNIASSGTKWLMQYALNVPHARAVSSFRAFRSSLMRDYPRHLPPAAFLDALLGWTAQHVTSVPVVHNPRASGKSNYTWPKLIRHGVDMAMSLSVVPLRAAAWLGFLIALIGVGLFVFVVAAYFLHGREVPGFTFLAAVILLFAGAQLSVLGIIGEYLSRVYLRLLGKPAFVIKEIL
jgi:glycosyltransferase involved in cell wall biosynthesis